MFIHYLKYKMPYEFTELIKEFQEKRSEYELKQKDILANAQARFNQINGVMPYQFMIIYYYNT